MKPLFFSFVAIAFIAMDSRSQGCIMVRNISGFGQYDLTDNGFSTSSWQLNINNRYYKAFRDFTNDDDVNTAKQNESIIKSWLTDISLSKFLSGGWSLNLSLPVSANSRETTREHGGLNTKRYSTNSFGVGDIRFTAYKWLLAPSVKQRINVQVGLGIKLATGDYKYQDYFYKNDSTKFLSAVNPSIQLGDGGTGIISELNAFYIVNKTRTLSLYGNFYYLINPREQNGTSFIAGRALRRVDTLADNIIVSVPDQFSIRGGANFSIRDWIFSAGFRHEGIPVTDLLGGSEGIRRAGYNFSVEPGIIYKLKNATVYAYVPVIVTRKIKQNLADKFITKYTGVHTITSGGSGNYQVFLGIQFKF